VEEVQKCRTDAAYFIQNYCYINNPQTFKTFLFKFWDFQGDILDAFLHSKRVVILKARQLGVSWMVAAYALWMALFHDNANVLILSQKEDLAQDLLSKVKFMNDRLPEWLTQPVGQENLKLLEFYSKRFHSQIKALPATKEAGRSETASVVICDEHSFHPYAQENFAAVGPTIDAGGQFISVSTANGLGNFYYKLWKEAETSINGFTPLFLPYDSRPERRVEGWYEEHLKNYTGDPKLFQQEYPRNPMEAFISTGGCIFDLEGLQYIAEEQCTDPLTPDDVAKLRGEPRVLQYMNQYPHLIKFWKLPRNGRTYVLGADPAGGGSDGDFSAAMVVDVVTGEHLASLHGRLDPDSFAGHLVTVAEIYNNALIAVERNQHGYGVHSALTNAYSYGNIYKYPDDKKEGWPTNQKTKGVMNSKLQQLVRDRELQTPEMEFIYEAQSYVQRNNKVGAEEGMHDDRVVAMGIAQMALEKAQRPARARHRVTQTKHFKRRRI
jgi:hypothetical protein